MDGTPLLTHCPSSPSVCIPHLYCQLFYAVDWIISLLCDILSKMFHSMCLCMCSIFYCKVWNVAVCSGNVWGVESRWHCSQRCVAENWSVILYSSDIDQTDWSSIGNNNNSVMFIMLSACHSHCESLLSSCNECKLSFKWPLTLRQSHWLGLWVCLQAVTVDTYNRHFHYYLTQM